MGLPKIIQIPCHHVLANQNALKLKKGEPIKQICNINLGLGIIKKLLLLFVFFTYLPNVLLKFWSGELIRCGIKFCIQWVPTRHTFDGPLYPKNNKYLKKCDDHPTRTLTAYFWQTPLPQKQEIPEKKRDEYVIITFSQVFIVFGVVGSVKSMQCGYSLDEKLNSASNELSRSEFE